LKQPNSLVKLMEIYLRVLYALVLVMILAYIIKKKGYLDDIGVAVSTLMAFIILIGTDIKWLLIILSFLVLGSLVSRVGCSKKESMRLYQCRRSLKNVVANGLVAFLIVVLYMLGILDYNTALFGYVGAISAATSDTFSSELGILSRETPRLITTFEKVERGTDGGITLWGTVAGLIGSFLIGLLATLLFNNYYLLIVSTLAGILGNLSDSLSGALFERKGILNNEHVNFICTLVGSISAVLMYKLLSLF